MKVTDVLKNVTLNRDPSESLGICIKEVERSVTPENRSNSDVRQSSVIVSRLIPGGVAEKYGTLSKGDEIVSVNNRDVSQLTLKEVAALMDCHKHLDLTIRSNCNNANNNNNILDSDQDDSIALMRRVCHDIFEQPPQSENTNGPNSTTSNKTVRDHPIRSIYDNNFPSLLDPIFSKLSEAPVGRGNIGLEREYNDALHILLDAIKSFESPLRSPQSYHSSTAKSSSSSFWDGANGHVDGSSENIPSLILNDSSIDLNPASSSNTVTSTSSFPSFPDLPDEPEIPVLQSEVSISEEIQVDGMSQKCSSYKRSHSFSSYPSDTHSRERFTVHTPSFREERYRFLGHTDKTANSVSRGTSVDKIDEVEWTDSSIYPSQSMQSELDNQQTMHGTITVGQRQQWSGKGKDNFNENISESENNEFPSGSTPSLVAENPAKYQHNQTPQQDPKSNHASPSPDEKSAKSVFKIDLSSSMNAGSSQDATPSTGSKKIWERIGSPASLRKSKFSRTFSKMTRRKPESSADWDSADSTPDMKVDPSVIERYNLELGDAHNHRLSSYFIPRNSQNSSIRKPLDLSEFKKHKQSVANVGKYSFSSSQNPIKGSLVITLYGARDLKKVVSGVYCICQVDDDLKHRIKTSMRPCNGSVAWNECYEAKLEEANDLYLSLYAWESESQHKELAKARLPISELLSDQLGVALKLAVKLEPRGTVYVKLSLEESSKLEGPRVFGADLQSILGREKTGLPIPLLVRDCIKEVEHRGMAIVGIYRLCGSAIAKRELRGKYENDSTSVNLCPEEYPDVNVITGILKDFLRELPQPLLPPELLEAVTQSMGDYAGSSDETCPSSPLDGTPPDGSTTDQDNSAKRHSSLILKIIEVEKKVSLAPNEKATLYALLNHLKRISTNHEKNKMTCQNLAVCFGPVLLGSVNSPPTKGLDLNAAIGFKQHIQVLNFMVSNWPEEPVQLSDCATVSTTSNNTEVTAVSGHNALKSNRVSTVSLTRRISRLLPDDTDDTDAEMVDVEPFFQGANYALRHSQRSGSLTDILESNFDGTGGEDDFDIEV